MTVAIFTVTPVSALEKIFPTSRPTAAGPSAGGPSPAGPATANPLHVALIREVTGLAGETVSFQLAYRVEPETQDPNDADRLRQTCVNQFVTHVTVSGALADRTRVRAVRNVQVDFAAYPGTVDDAYLSDQPGQYPDLLQDTDGWVAFMPGQWRSLWVDVELPAMDEPQEIPNASDLTFTFTDRAGTTVAATAVSVHRISAQLPELTIAHTEWLHADCLAQWYGVPVWSEEHWRIVERFVRLAAKRGMTMLYTPLFTPPLDTVVGGERLTTQLVGVTRIESSAAATGTADTDDIAPGVVGASGDSAATPTAAWQFDFSKLERWVRMAQAAGIRWFEMSHLFTQWGAAHCPKIIAAIDGEERRPFGWRASATDPADGYPEFLAAFLTALDRELHRLGIADNTVFHVSDEPTADQLGSYLKAKAVVAPYLKNYRIMDALSHVEFYESGACEHPIPADDAIEPFVQAHVPDLWTYYCCAQTTNVPNRFMAMPSYRNRVLGLLLYTYDLAGFLHWGFNFYNAQYSLRPINPYTEAGTPEGFAAGDAFLVYPGPGGAPEESIRIMVVEEALNDLRACRLLESLIGRERTLAIVSEGLGTPLTFADYPQSADWLLGRRDAINQAIAQAIAARP
ncbi:DUF4091 domain-containing protein [Bifidobacterium longum]|uniref:DUF4091 domain-containing protein n=1 Tax=Bifidobacterium longum TaxID=216816 RepID=UPI0008F81C27|nr:DUF4091 domain-containing protein [Bifidobacterium longum]OIN64665.1 hypothetical protein BFS25_02685 [Bifidobacterium longum subsp. infantis]